MTKGRGGSGAEVSEFQVEYASSIWCPYTKQGISKVEMVQRWAITQQTQNISVTILESCSLVASDLTLQKRFYNVLSDLCIEIRNIQKHVW